MNGESYDIKIPPTVCDQFIVSEGFSSFMGIDELSINKDAFYIYCA